jgi:hypothetical protein
MIRARASARSIVMMPIARFAATGRSGGHWTADCPRTPIVR